MGHIRHSTNTCINAVNHTDSEMRNNLVKQIVRSKSRISLIIDESTTLSKKSTLILYIHVFISNCGMSAPVNLFLDLTEL
jgi:hypothetical protein